MREVVSNFAYVLQIFLALLGQQSENIHQSYFCPKWAKRYLTATQRAELDELGVVFVERHWMRKAWDKFFDLGKPNSVVIKLVKLK